jgi:hypothetical protein
MLYFDGFSSDILCIKRKNRNYDIIHHIEETIRAMQK